MPAPGAVIRVRPVRAGDQAAIGKLLTGLDPESSYRRWFTGAVNLRRAVDSAAHPERFNAVGLLALADGEAVGHGVLIPAGDRRAEVAFEVAAPWRRHGIAGTLLAQLIDAARGRGLREVYAEVLSENRDMLAVLREHGEHDETHEGGVTRVTLPVLSPYESSSSPRSSA